MPTPSIILHLDQSRSGGHLLQRILEPQPKRQFLDHPFSQARGKQVQWLIANGENAVENGMPENLREEWEEEIEKGKRIWEEGVKEAEKKGNTLFIQDHCFNSAPPETVQQILQMIEKGEAGPSEGENVIHLPETLLLQPGITPLFTIRDPRLAVPSAYRVLKKFGLPHGSGRANFSVSTNLIWIRMQYKWFVAHGMEPVIVDCDDVQCAETSDFVQRLCVKLGLDPEKIQFSWPRVSDKERAETHPSHYTSQSTLLESEGVDARLAARHRDLLKEEESWEEEFGEDLGLVRQMIGQADVHYRWLMERRFRWPYRSSPKIVVQIL